jgi:hypothetical protein
MVARWLSLLTVSMWAHTGLAAELPDYVRYAEDRSSVRLEVAIRSFAMPSGQSVDLIGVVHIADDSYYQVLNQRFDAYDSVLFELIGDPASLTKAAPEGSRTGSVSVVQQSAGKHLGLTFQLDAIDYAKKNMVHADTTMEEFARMQHERGENFLTLFGRAMQAQLSGGVNRKAMREFDTFGLIRILMSEDSAAAFKKSLAKVFDDMESMTAIMEGQDGSVVLSGRNGVVIAKIKEVLARRKQRRIAVFYGGAHMPGIESALVSDMNAKVSGEEWLPAWTMPKRPAPSKPVKPASASSTP